MSLLSSGERAARWADWQRRHPGAQQPPVHVLAPGVGARRRHATREETRQVRALLDRHEQQLADLTAAQARTFLPVLQQAEHELAVQLRRWVEVVPDGELRWTAHSYRAAIGQIHEISARLELRLAQRTAASADHAQRLALDHLTTEVARFSQIFEGAPRRVLLDVSRLIVEAKSYIIPRIRSSAARYGADRGPVGVAHDLRQRLAVDILKGAPVHETVGRLVEHGGPRGLVSLRGVAGEAGSYVENIPEGLFVRYRHWAERIVRTETASAYNVQLLDGLYAARKQVPGLLKCWWADATACAAICAPMNGEMVALEKSFLLPNGDAVDNCPGHPNCGCRSGAWHSDWPEILRAARA